MCVNRGLLCVKPDLLLPPGCDARTGTRVVLLPRSEGPHHARPQGLLLLRGLSSRELRRFGQTKPYEGGGVTKQPHDSVSSVFLYLPSNQHRREPIIIITSSHPHHQFLRLGSFNTHKVQLAREEEGPGLSPGPLVQRIG
jgi:hypothetical protein